MWVRFTVKRRREDRSLMTHLEDTRLIEISRKTQKDSTRLRRPAALGLRQIRLMIVRRISSTDLILARGRLQAVMRSFLQTPMADHLFQLREIPAHTARRSRSRFSQCRQIRESANIAKSAKTPPRRSSTRFLMTRRFLKAWAGRTRVVY
jgi:hypothetical protein